MDKKVIENINIEKNKELFEYEMTDVILKLKGEFAAFSGKGTKYEANKVAEEKLKLELYPLKDVSWDTYKGKVPNINILPVVLLNNVEVDLMKIDDMSSKAWHMGEVHFNPLIEDKISIIDIPRTDYQFNDVKLCVKDEEKLKKIEVKTIPKIDVKCTSFVVEEKKRIAVNTIPEFSFEYNSFDIEQENFIGTINIPSVSSNVGNMVDIPKVETVFDKVEVPNTTIKVLKGSDVNVERITVNIPKTDINCSYSSTEIKTESNAVQLNVPSINLGEINKAYDIPQSNIRMVQVPTPKQISIETVANENIKLHIPNTDVEQYKKRDFLVEKKASISEIPEMPIVNKFSIDKCEITQKEIEEIMIPHFEKNEFKVNKIEMKLMQRLDVPLKPDVISDINKILSLVSG